jgi:tRNA(fMet)-specific endonuclease VapC
MPGDLLVDTSVAVDYLRGDPAAGRVIAAASRLCSASVVLGELLHGAERSPRPAENLDRVERFASQVEILPVDEGTAHHYSEIRTSLANKGRPIPENDIWIAAVGRQHRLTVVTRDSHFTEVPGLALLAW